MLNRTNTTWTLKPLSEVVDINPRLDKSAYRDDLEVSFVPMAAVEAGSGRMDVSESKHFGSVKKGYTPFKEGDVLFAKITPCMENGKMAVVPKLINDIGFGSTEFHVLRPHEGIHPRYVYYFVSHQNFRREAAHQMSGAVGQKRVPQSFLEAASIPVPLFEEQQRIVAEIEKQFSRLDEAVASLKRTKANLKRYKAAVLKAAVEGKLTEDWRKQHPDVEPASKLLERILAERHMRWKGKGKYQDPAVPEASSLSELPDGWIWARWGQIGFSQNGRAFPSSQYQPSGFRLLRPGNLHVSGKVVWTDENTRCMPAKWAEKFPEFVVGSRELIMNLTAQSLKDEFLGRVCLTGPGEACLLNQRQARLTPVLVIPEFLLWLFKSSIFRRFVDGLNTGSLIQHMFTSQLADFVLPLPPIDEQEQIVAEVERRLSVIDEVDATVEANLVRADRLRQTILAQAFCGKLTYRMAPDLS